MAVAIGSHDKFVILHHETAFDYPGIAQLAATSATTYTPVNQFRPANHVEKVAMFTGLVEGMGRIDEILDQPPGKRFAVALGDLAQGLGVGDSVAVNGCCLTAVAVLGDRLSFEAGSETLSRTNLGKLVVGSQVNIERSLRLGDSLGGHLVTGHIDGQGELVLRKDDKDWSFLWFRTPRRLMRQMASKGSVTVDGVSLTLVDVDDDQFSVALIPHTLAVTTLGQLAVGDTANIETDILAKYVERQLTWTERGSTDG